MVWRVSADQHHIFYSGPSVTGSPNMLEERLEDTRPAKRHRPDSSTADSSTDKDASLVKRHPLGVRPSGNALTSSVNCKTSCGLFAYLPDELLGQLLEYLDAPALLRLGGTCRGLHAFTRNEELWRALFVEYVLHLPPERLNIAILHAEWDVCKRFIASQIKA